MRRWHRWVVVAASLLPTVVAGCGGDAPGWSEADRSFVARMIPHHHLGMTLVDEATVHSADVRLRRLVFEMSGYHQSELDTLIDWADSQGIEPAVDFPGDLTDTEVAALADLDGAAHDIRWLDLMIRHHRGAVEMADEVIAGGDVADVIALANNVRRVQSSEIEQMDDLRRTLCAEQPADMTPAGC